MKRGDKVFSDCSKEYQLYVGTTPYGREITASEEKFESTCKWFDSMESMSWNEF